MRGMPVAAPESWTLQEVPEVMSPAPRDLWRTTLAGDPAALLSHTPEWLDMICVDGRWRDASRYYRWRSGDSLVLPLVSKTIPGFGQIVESLPAGWGFGGFVGADARPELIPAVYEDLRRQRTLRLRICPNPLQGHAWTLGLDKFGASEPAIIRRAHVIDLKGGPGVVWKAFSDNVRRGIRKAEKQGLDIECDTSGNSLGVFDDLWRRSTERWAAQQHLPTWLVRARGNYLNPAARWQQIVKRTGGATATWVARWRGEPAAAIIVLRGSNDHYTRGAMNKALAGPTRANFLLHWLAIQDACRRNVRWYQMGQSGRGTDSVARFKEGFGAQAHEFPELIYERLPITALRRRAWALASAASRTPRLHVEAKQ